MRKITLFLVSFFFLALTMSAQVIDVPLIDDADDVEEKGDGSMDNQSSDIEMIYENEDYHNGDAFRFQALAIPQGATITNAYIQFTVDEDGEDGDVTLTWHADDVDNSAAFDGTPFEVSDRTKTAAFADWAPAVWAGNEGARGEDQRTVDLSELVQSIVDREGWAEGNAMTFIVTGPTDVPVNRIAVSYSGDATNAAALHVEFESGPPPVGAELVGYWGFDEGAGLTVADGSGSGLDGTLNTEANWVDGISGSAIHFDTEETFMKTAETLILSNVSASISMWVKWPEGMFDGWSAYVEYHRDFSTSWLGFFSRQDESFMKLGSDGLSAYANGFTPDPMMWYNFVGTTDENGVFKIYLNGELVGEETGDPRVVSTTPKVVSIGGNNDGGEYPNAVIDEVKYYKGTLTSDQVKDAYDEMANPAAALLAHYAFEDGEGDIVTDDSGNGFDGTLLLPEEGGIEYNWIEDGYQGGAIHLDRAYMKTPADKAFATNAKTFTAWVKLNAELDEWGAMFTYASHTDDYVQFGFNKGSRQIYFYSPSLEFGAETPLEIGMWYHVAMTITEDGTVSVYLNGNLDGKGEGFPSVSSPDLEEACAFGSKSDGSGNTLNDWDLDEASIYSGAMSEAQIKKSILDYGMVAHWMFDETSGTVAHDISGNNIDLNLMNTSDENWVDGGVHFNGVDQYGLVSKEMTTQYFENPNFTVATWINVKEDIIVDGNARIAGMDDPFGINLKGADNNGRVKVYVWDGSSWTGDYITQESFSDGTWRHFAVTHSTETGSTAFIDGEKAGTVDNPNIAFVQNAYFAIAASVSPEDESTKWLCDAGFKDFRVYPKVLSDEDIAILAGKTDPPVPVGLATHFIFDEFEAGDGNTIADVSGNLMDGVQHGPYTYKVDGIYGSAIEFNPEALDLDESSDPNNNCVVLPENVLYASQEFTVAAWINASNDTLVFDSEWGEWGAIFAHDIGGAADYGLFYDPYGSTMGVWSEGMGEAYLGGGEILVGEWNHVALSINAADSMLTLYVNGEEVSSTKVSQLLPAEAVADTSCIGGSIERSKPYFGKIDDFRFYTYALSAEEIAELGTRNYLLTLEVSMGGETPLGTITADPEGDEGYYAEGTEVTLTAEPIEGFAFIEWTGGATGTDNPITITMDSDKEVMAVFEKPKYALNVTIVGNGSVSPQNGEYEGVIFLTATADDGWEFDSWSGDVTGTDNPAFVDMSADKNITATFIESDGIDDPLMKQFALKSYPNPFSDKATISYTLKNASDVQIVVYDQLGKQVKSLVNQLQQPGDYKVELDASDMNSGVYFYQFRSGSQIITKKILLSK